MKKQLVVCILLLLITIAANAETKIPLVIEGTIGDYAPKSRTYEVDRTIYKFPANITIENKKGQVVGFKSLRGGMVIKIIAEKIIADDLSEKVEYKKIIVLK